MSKEKNPKEQDIKNHSPGLSKEVDPSKVIYEQFYQNKLTALMMDYKVSKDIGQQKG